MLHGPGQKAFAPGNDVAGFETERTDAAQARGYGVAMRATLDAVAGCRHPAAIVPGDPSAEGRIWFPVRGACTSGGWGTIAAGALRIDQNRRLCATGKTVEPVVDGRCAPATAVVEAGENRLRVTRPNPAAYTCHIELGR